MPFKRGHLCYFVTVAEEGQITRAAAKLHIAQPALSQAIAQLESELDLRLLERHPRGVTLTSDGEAFFQKARAAVSDEQEAVLTARSLSRAAKGTIEVGFIGPPPKLNVPELFEAFAEAHPEAEVAFRDLPFPCGATASWLEQVDVALCHTPRVEPGIEAQALRVEPRAVIARKDHPLAGRTELTAAEVLDDTFVGYHPAVQPAWTAFHNLDDHRGGPPLAMTVDDATTTMQMLATMTTGRAVTTVPLSDARFAPLVSGDLVAIPLSDAKPAVRSLVWRSDTHNPLVQALLEVAADLADGEVPPAG